MKQIYLLLTITFLMLSVSTNITKGCVLMWNAESNTPTQEICPVMTTSGQPCSFPFLYLNKTYSTCIINSPNNPSQLPQCLTSNKTWSVCLVPTTAVVNYITTKTGGSLSQNGASIRGGTLVWIYGKRFAKNAFSISPTTSTSSNKVIFQSQYAAYTCELHLDKTTETQITCYTQVMPADTYTVFVWVNGAKIPYYQYTDISTSLIKVSYDSTPLINNITPYRNVPNSFVSLQGNFKTECYSRDIDSCSDVNSPRITRVFFGPQLCDLINQTSNTLYYLNSTSLNCKLSGTTVALFNTSMLVSENYGRAEINEKLYFITPNEIIYNYQTYAEIDSISPEMGSNEGGTDLTITGKYLFHSNSIPAHITIGSRKCTITGFDNSNQLKSTIKCATDKDNYTVNTQSENVGNRGIVIIRDNVFTSFNNLEIATPSGSSNTSWSDEASFIDSQNKNVTIWLMGFIKPGITSNYVFSIQSNALTKLFLSNDSTKFNEQLIASYNLITNNISQAILLNSSNNYYLRAISSKLNGNIKLSINVKMLDCSLNSKVTNKIKTEVQEVFIASTIVPESTLITYANTSFTSGTREIQELVFSSNNFDDIILNFDGANTKRLSYGSSAQQIKDALNDLPTLIEAYVDVNATTDINGNFIYKIIFTSDHGDVPEISETLGLVTFKCTEIIKGVASNRQIQIKIQNSYTQLINPLNDSIIDISSKIKDVFGIRCPKSIISTDSQVTAAIFDYESECIPNEQPLNQTAFCGFCSRYKSNELFSGLMVPLTYNYLCFAYKIRNNSTTVSQITYYVIVDGSTNLGLSSKISTIADNQWHYVCIDIYQDVLLSMNSDSNTYSSSRIILRAAYLYPMINDFYIDTLSIRSKVPLGYGDVEFEFSRRLIPSIQFVHNTLNISRNSNKNELFISYRPNNCTTNLNQIEIRQTITSNVTSLSRASGPVTGSFNLTWMGQHIGTIQANSTEYHVKNLLKAINGLENVEVVRTQDCAGFKWNIKWFYGGDKQQINVSSSLLNGSSPSVEVRTIVDGGIEFNPIPGDMLRTVSSKQQVSVIVNGIPSKCTNSCSFEYSSLVTPIVDTITISSGLVKITGSAFDGINLVNNLVFIGSTRCNVTEATSTNLTCVPGDGPVGNYSFNVQILGKGYAVMNSNTQYTFPLIVNSFSPLAVGSGGGVSLIITGSGFSSRSTVQIDDIDCPVQSVTYNQITCLTPTNPTISDKQASIVVTDGSYITNASAQLSIINTDISQVTSVTPSSGLSVLGGQTITIIGVGFNTSIKQVIVGTKIAIVQLFNSTTIIITSPKMSPGKYQIIIPSGTLGNAKVTTQLDYTFYVSSFIPSIGSIRGGTLVTIYGEGFNTDCSLNKVSFERASCELVSCTSQWIQCKTSSAYHVYNIDNTGIDLNYGTGYQWNQSYLNINKGDTVQWYWNAPGSVNNVKYMIEQIKDPTSMTPIGFSSGSPTPSGTYSYQFNSEGTFYYWSGYVDSSFLIALRGVINVSPTTDFQEELIVTQGGTKAQTCIFPFNYNGQTYSTCTTVNFGYSWCSPTKDFSGQVLKCNPQSQPATLPCPGSTVNTTGCTSTTIANANNMQFVTCNVPEVTSISSLSGSLGDQITISGKGFSSDSCENTINIGDYSCPVNQSSSTSLICQIGSNSGLLPNQRYRIEVNVANIGNAIQNSWYRFKYTPTISSITPSIGSQFGGSFVTILGDGFDSTNTFVFIDNAPITLSTVYYNQITFTTQASSTGIKSLRVVVNSVNATCKVTSGVCTYEFSSTIAPTVTSVTPTSISGPSTLTITGTNFGSNSNAITVLVGSQSCSIVSVASTSLTCSVSGISNGPQSISLNVNGVGRAASSNTVIVTGVPVLSSMSPTSGSVNGGTLISISGNGFDQIANTQITVGGQLCSIKSLSISQIECLTPSGTGTAVVSVLSNNIEFPTLSFTYDSLTTPELSSILPVQGSTDQIVNLTGTSFGTNKNAISVYIGGSACSITSVTDTQIVCTTGPNIAGSFNIVVRLDNIGYSNSNIKFVYNLILSALSRSQSGFAGGLEVILSGQGFDGSNSSVSVCSVACPIVSVIGTTQVTCQVPSQTYSTTDKSCSLDISVNGATASLPFTYVSALTPTISSVSPARGGTAGGTLITITGSGFPLTQSDISVSIAGSSCQLNTLSSTTITCYTGKYSQSSIKSSVQVFINNVGLAMNIGNTQFEYLDLWSSIYTWGGQSVPQEGELVLIGPGQTIYFDTVTPVLKGVIIQGGSLIFDDFQDVNLNTEYIIITDNGKLQVGTEIKPFTHKATITMFGSLRSIELPIYGSKVIALRNGTLDLHGKPVGVTWTYLGMTASAFSDTIQLMQEVEWPIGSKILIATTGDMYSIGESEVRIITNISSDKKTLTLDTPLKFTHLSEAFKIGNITVYKRAEVGVLSRNVVFNAINDNSWNSLRSANACPDGFDPGEFATMTCFLGRYGDEIGSDEFGATIMIHSSVKNKFNAESVIARISNVELTHVGQAFRLGRYPIHFHLIGDSPSSYVRECAIYESFNRAVNMHGTNYVRIERTVIYNIMGGAFFLEDGVEHGNVYDGNLAVYVKVSSSGINEDGTPAAFWATNPNNTYINNAVAGCTHFGYWYRLLEKPEGPSFDSNYCPRKQPFGRFFNNTAHSIGRFGLWIFPSYTPTVSGSCYDSSPSVAKFEKYTSYGCDKGAEWVESGPLQFNNFIIYDHATTGIETKTIANHDNFNPTRYFPLFFSESNGPLVSNSIIIGNSDTNAVSSKSSRGLIIAWERGQLIKNVTFINFPDSNSYAIGATSIIGRCSVACGGWETQFSSLQFINVKQRTIHRWNWDVVMKDIDGTLSGTSNSLVLYNGNMTRADSRCNTRSEFYQGTICKQKNHIRFAFNNFISQSVVLIYIRNEKNITDEGFNYKKRLTHPLGFMVSLEVNQTYFIEFDQFNYPINITYSAGIYSIIPNSWVIIKHEMNKKPDEVTFGSESFIPLSFEYNKNFDWYWDNSTRQISYMICNKGITPMVDYSLRFSAKKCRYEKCKIPEQPSQRLPITSRPSNALFWSNTNTWLSYGYLSNLPKENDTLVIKEDDYIVADIRLPKLRRLEIKGYLEFDDSLDNALFADEIFINGGQFIIGWETSPFKHIAEIILTGTRKNEEFILPNGFDSIGNKAIGVYGGLSLHGIPRKPSWTRLARSAFKGSNTLNLVDAVDWKPGEEIVLTTTSYDPWQTETFKIESISSNNKTITLNSSLEYTHVADSESYPNGKSYSISAGVGLLTRNIKIIGSKYPEQWEEKMGSHILISDYSDSIYPEGSTTPISIYYKGYARLSDVEFIHSGQVSRNTDDDYKAAILYSNLGKYDTKRPSYVRSCSFHNGFSGAILITGSSSIPIENNVIHHTIDFAMKIDGDSNIVRKNLIALNVWSSTYTPKTAPFDIHFYGAITVPQTSNSIVLEDNLITGSERIGLMYRGSPCTGLSSLGNGLNHSIVRNHIYGCLTGVTIFPKDVYSSLKCIQINDFTVYKNIYWGIYYQGLPNLVLENNTLVDNTVGIFTQVIGPSSLSHAFDNKFVLNRNNIFIGRSASFNCTTDIIPNTICLNFSKIASSANTPSGGHIGIYGSSFVDGSNNAPLKPWRGIMTYNTIGGQVSIENTTFARYTDQCDNKVDVAITNSQSNDDGQHPILTRAISMYNVTNSSKIFFFRPNRNKINPSDCVDMDCDGMKKNLITDNDGSLLGKRGAVISQSEFGWNSQDRGIGDYRVPMAVFASANGTMLPISSVYTYQGIVRDEKLCSYRSDWQAYECYGLEYKVLIIESMDSDTETRRLSPVAILSDNKYIDLINGPQDHGWCSGYTCQKRISTFLALVASNKSYDVYLTSTPPNTLRFRIINADINFKIRLSMHYFTSNSVNAYKGSSLVDPTNADRSKGYLVLKDPYVNGVNYIPKIGDPCGTNFMSRKEQKLYFSLDGSDYVDLKISPEIFVTFGVPAQTADQFFHSSNVVNNIAQLLGVSPDMIRRVQLVSANNSTRVARQASSIYNLEIVVTDDPIIDSNNFSAYDTNMKNLEKIASQIVNQAHIGLLQQKAQELFNLTIESIAYDHSSNEAKSNSSVLKTVEKIAKIVTIQEFSGCRAQSPCDQQAVVAVQDQYGNTINNLGISGSPWTIKASVFNSSSPTSIVLQSEAEIIDGYARFTQLGLSHSTNLFTIQFSFGSIVSLNKTHLESYSINATPSSVNDPLLRAISLDSAITIQVNNQFSLQFSIGDQKTGLKIPNITWKGLTWTSKLTMFSLSKWQLNGTLNATYTQASLNPSNGVVIFSNLSINQPGAYLLKTQIYSSDGLYNLTTRSNLIRVLSSTESFTESSTSEPSIKIIFEGDYDLLERNDELTAYKAMLNNFMISEIKASITSEIYVYKGSVAFAFDIDTAQASLLDNLINTANNSSNSSLLPGLSIKYISLYGSIYNLSATETFKPKSKNNDNKENSSLNIGAIIGGVIGGLAAVVLIAFGTNSYYQHRNFQKRKIVNREDSQNQEEIKEPETKLKKVNPKRQLLNDNEFLNDNNYDNIFNDCVTISRKVDAANVFHVALPNTLRPTSETNQSDRVTRQKSNVAMIELDIL